MWTRACPADAGARGRRPRSTWWCSAAPPAARSARGPTSASSPPCGRSRSGRGAYGEAVEAGERALMDFPRPTVALVEGFAIGGGTQLAVACDLRVCEARSRFGVTPAKLGIVYAQQSTARLVEVVGAAWARWILLTGDLLDAEQALRDRAGARGAARRRGGRGPRLRPRRDAGLPRPGEPGGRQGADRPGRGGPHRRRRRGARALRGVAARPRVRRGRGRVPGQAAGGVPGGPRARAEPVPRRGPVRPGRARRRRTPRAAAARRSR